MFLLVRREICFIIISAALLPLRFTPPPPEIILGLYTNPCVTRTSDIGCFVVRTYARRNPENLLVSLDKRCTLPIPFTSIRITVALYNLQCIGQLPF